MQQGNQAHYCRAGKPGRERSGMGRKREEKGKKGITRELWQVWEARCSRFRHVEWVRQWKPGVKILKDK